MKPVLEYLPLEGHESFFAKEFNLPYFGTPWHYHREYELVLVIESQGKRFIGNVVSEFNSGYLTFLGPDLPHLYRNSPDYYQNNSSFRARSIVIHFIERSLGLDFLALPQMKKVNRLFELSKQGMDIYGETKRKVVLKMEELLQTSCLQRLICLLEILNILADSTEIRLISEPGIVGYNAFETERLNLVFQYMIENFNEDIQLEDVASLIHMTRCSFCRFLKDRTKRTFSNLLTEIRLNHAAKLLVESKADVIQIAYESGYNNMSNFNRQFKKKFLMSPKKYKVLYYQSNNSSLPSKI